MSKNKNYPELGKQTTVCACVCVLILCDGVCACVCVSVFCPYPHRHKIFLFELIENLKRLNRNKIKQFEPKILQNVFWYLVNVFLSVVRIKDKIYNHLLYTS